MEERNEPAEQENKKKPYKRPEVVSEEVLVRTANCCKLEGDPGCLLFIDVTATS